MSRRERRKRAAALLGAGIGSLTLWATASAHAATVRCDGFSWYTPASGGTLAFSAGEAERNNVTLTATKAGALRLRDQGNRLQIERGSRSRLDQWQCQRRGAGVLMPAATQWRTFELRLGAHPDRATLDLRPLAKSTGGTVRGGAGDDSLSLHGGASAIGVRVLGEAGNDHIALSWTEAPRLRRSVVDAPLFGPPFRRSTPAFLVGSGGPGDDVLEVTAPTTHNRPLLVREIRNTRPTGNYRDGSVRQFLLSGGDGDDLLIGNAGPDELDGGNGNDRIVARGGGPDVLKGGRGDDRIELDGSAPIDGVRIDCGPGDDTLVLNGHRAPPGDHACETVLP
ncbi:MAG TPA: hypothetical protein VNS09_27515 [Solirubrobacter sp.]|nr:hypothetical protein [Solirubrobacter sp.]